MRYRALREGQYAYVWRKPGEEFDAVPGFAPGSWMAPVGVPDEAPASSAAPKKSARRPSRHAAGPVPHPSPQHFFVDEDEP